MSDQQNDAQEIRGVHEDLANALVKARLELQAARREIVELTGAREDLARALAEARGEIQDKNDAIYSGQREAGQLARRVHAEQAERSRLEALLNQTRDSTSARLATVETKAAKLEAERYTACKERDAARTELTRLEALLNSKQDDMTCAKTEALGLHQKVEILRRELDAERSAMGELERRHAAELRFERSARVGLNATLDGCRADRDSTRAYLATVEAKAAKLEAERYTACEERDAARTESAEAMTRVEKAELRSARSALEQVDTARDVAGAALVKAVDAVVRHERDGGRRLSDVLDWIGRAQLAIELVTDETEVLRRLQDARDAVVPEGVEVAEDTGPKLPPSSDPELVIHILRHQERMTNVRRKLLVVGAQLVRAREGVRSIELEEEDEGRTLARVQKAIDSLRECSDLLGLPPPGAEGPDKFFAEVLSELGRALAMHPGRRVMMIALQAQAGDLARAVLNGSATHVRREAVQMAAIAARVALQGDDDVHEFRASKGLDALGGWTLGGGTL